MSRFYTKIRGEIIHMPKYCPKYTAKQKREIAAVAYLRKTGVLPTIYTKGGDILPTNKGGKYA